MLDFSRVQNYYIACGYTDMRKQIDGLAALVQTQFGQEMEETSLYRQEQMWKRMGVELKRGTMANWVIQVADLYLRPFWKRIRSELLTQITIHADETVMQVLKEKGKPATEPVSSQYTNRAFLWARTNRTPN